MPSTKNKVLSFVFFAFALRESSAAGTRGSVVEVQASEIVPALHPEGDNKFFNKDYPDDLRPEPLHEFDVPFPLVQDSDDYDKDFVQDENNDVGVWTAQMEYDTLKNRLARERQEMNRAKQKMEEEKREYEVISGKEADAETATKALEEDAEKAADAAAKKEDKEAEIKRQQSGHAEHVETETQDLKKCENELQAAKEELQKVLEQLKVVEADANAAADKADEAEAGVEAAEKDESLWEEKVDRADKNHNAILTKYDDKKLQLKAMEKNLADAAKILAKFRAPQMDSKGSVVDDKSGDPVSFHSDGSRAKPLVHVAIAALCVWAAL